MSQPTVQDVFRSLYRVLLAERQLPERYRRVAEAIILCRSGAYGTFRAECPEGHEAVVLNKSCWDRNCPGCRFMKQELWLEGWRGRLPLCAYHHIIFTLPEEFRPLFRFCERVMSDILFFAAKHTIIHLMKEAEYCGGTPGVLVTRHTWGQRLQLHPHAHCLVTSGGLNDDDEWVDAKKQLLLPFRAVEEFFKGAFLRVLREKYSAGLVTLPPDMTRQQYDVVYEKTSELEWKAKVMERYEHPHGVLEYLARYIRGGPIGNSRIVAFDGRNVTFRYDDNRIKDPHVPKSRTMTLDGVEFMMRFLSHCPPKGYLTTRSYGLFANTNIRRKLTAARKARGQAPVEKKKPKATLITALEKKGKRAEACCSICQKPYVYVFNDDRFLRSREYLHKKLLELVRPEVPP